MLTLRHPVVCPSASSAAERTLDPFASVQDVLTIGDDEIAAGPAVDEVGLAVVRDDQIGAAFAVDVIFAAAAFDGVPSRASLDLIVSGLRNDPVVPLTAAQSGTVRRSVQPVGSRRPEDIAEEHLYDSGRRVIGWKHVRPSFVRGRCAELDAPGEP